MEPDTMFPTEDVSADEPAEDISAWETAVADCHAGCCEEIRSCRERCGEQPEILNTIEACFERIFAFLRAAES